MLRHYKVKVKIKGEAAQVANAAQAEACATKP
jgi:hypothetical protein